MLRGQKVEPEAVAEGAVEKVALSLPADDDCDDIEDWLGIFLDDPSDFDPLSKALDLIEQIIGFGTTLGDLDTILLKLTKSSPVGVISCLLAIDKVLKSEQRRNTYKHTNAEISTSVLSVTLSGNLARFQAVSGITGGTVRLWSADGHVVGEYTFHGQTLTLPLSTVNGETLSNGVYYYIASLQNAEGTVAQTTVQKLVVVR